MNPEDKQNLVNLITNVHGFYKEPCSKFSLGVWLNALNPFSFEEIDAAFTRHSVDPDAGQFMPKPANIVKILGGTSKDQALIAWSKVDEAIRCIGTYESVVFDDAIIHLVISDMGGWVRLGNKTSNEWDFVRNEFESRYKNYTLATRRPTHLPRMVGLTELHNISEGQKRPLARLLGNLEIARQVYNSGESGQGIGLSPVSGLIDHGQH